METRCEWMLCAQAILRMGATLVTLYATLGDEGIAHVIDEIEATHLVTSSDLLCKLKTIATKQGQKSRVRRILNVLRHPQTLCRH